LLKQTRNEGSASRPPKKQTAPSAPRTRQWPEFPEKAGRFELFSMAPGAPFASLQAQSSVVQNKVAQNPKPAEFADWGTGRHQNLAAVASHSASDVSSSVRMMHHPKSDGTFSNHYVSVEQVSDRKTADISPGAS
jgi:hypothetical protein